MAGAAAPLAAWPQVTEPDAPEPAYPDDAFSRPLSDRRHTFETLDGVGPFLMVDDRVAHFADQDFRLHSEGGRTLTRWRFRSRGLDHNVLFIQERIRRAPRSISLRVANRSTNAVKIQMEAHELGWLPVPKHTGAVWTLGAAQTLEPSADQVIAFAISEARAEGRDRVRYPLGALLVKLTGVKPDVPYEFHISDLTVHYDPARGVVARSLEAELSGSEVAVRIAASMPTQPQAPLDLECRRDERVLWRIRLSAQEVTELSAGKCAVRRPIPWWVPAGPLTVGLVAGGYRVSGPEAVLQTPGRAAPAARLPKVERRTHKGRPAVFIDGKPFNWRGYSSYEYVPGSVGEFGASSADMFCVPTCAGRHMYQVAEPTWPAEGRTEFGELDERVCFSLQANPDAMISLRVALAMPPWWLQRNEEELARVETARGTLIWEEFAHARVASIASEKWFADQARALRGVIRHCKAQPWASRVAAIWLMGETTEEWFAWGSNDGYYSDYCAPMAGAFRRSTGESKLPTPEERKAPGWDVYQDTEAGRRASAYHGFLSDLTTRVLGRFARIVKHETQGRTLVCCFLGYVIQLAGEKRQALSGHFGLRRALDDPNLDMFAGVPLHDFRDLSHGYNPYCSATESIQAAGKLVCDENDLFSWLHNSLWHVLYDPADPRAGAISMHARECANDAVHGTIQQKFSLAASWHHDPELQRAFAHQARVYRDAMDADRRPAEEIAFLVDDTSFAWTPPETTLPAIANKHVLRDMGRTGAPVGVWLLSDIDRLPDRIRFVVVASSYAAGGRDIAKLTRALVNGGRTFWVIGAPGLVDVEKRVWSPDRPARTLGLPIRIRADELPGVVILTGEERGIPSLAKVRPRAEGDGAGWLRYQDGPCAGLERALPNGGRLIWSGVPVVESAMFRKWIERAGVHCHAPVGFFVHASRELVAVTAPVAHEAARIRWPRSVKATDMLDGWSGSGTEFACPFRLGQTRLFRVTPA
ncbi:MAG: hypothetical protein FJX72_01175 [Armatimonadetes bacterium]|nr:hypothetical protein [Armatimonadota bacterium]